MIYGCVVMPAAIFTVLCYDRKVSAEAIHLKINSSIINLIIELPEK